ncbi:hypothetical protein [Actinomycetospora soli]|uniref:hypothetical protein n=1 Tax=Actinomycetospora soli TaxID=2893887 RepID=UPI001E3170FB|nr:hypothetical protein [Actinomycetospora soli]MCD2188227.1 hypothetical protein [Actinomycetospora soli]
MADDDGTGRLPRAGEAVVEELVTLILDHVVPTVGWYRDQVAHRMGISPAAAAGIP